MTAQKVFSLNNIAIVVYALFILGGWQKRIHTEDIALKCFELAPTKFSWVKYQQYPDLLTVWYALCDAEKTRYGRLVIGGSERKRGKGTDVSTGWRLSDNGIDWIKANKDKIEAALFGAKLPQNRLIEERRLRTLINSSAFNKYLTAGDKAGISHAEFAESLVCTVNTKLEIISERIEQLRSVANLLNQNRVEQYLDFCQKQLTRQLSGGGDG